MKITDAFLGEHAVFYMQFTECEDLIGRADLGSLKDAAAVIAGALVSHAHLEDALLFGPLGARLTDGHEIFTVMEEEHQAIARLLGQVAMARDAGRAGELLTEVIHSARSHFAKEEQVAFPLAEQMLDAEELRRLGRDWSGARGVFLEDSAPQHRGA